MAVFNQLKLLIVSKTRLKLLEIFLSDTSKIHYVRELARNVNEQINAVRAELSRMEKAGMLYSEDRANRKYYGIRKDYLFIDELTRLVAKFSGLGANIIEEKAKLGKIKYAALTSRFIKRLENKTQEVDLIVVGELVLPELARLVRGEEERRGRDINYTVMTEEEFTFRKSRRDQFVLSILNSPKLMLIGDEDEMLTIERSSQ